METMEKECARGEEKPRYPVAVPKPSPPGEDDGKQKWEQRERIGQGASAQVFHAIISENSKHVAVKQFSTFDITPAQRAALYHEIELMAQVEHKHIVSFYGASEDDSTMNLFLEYAAKGSLEQRLRQGKLSEQLAARYIRQIVKAIRYLHKQGIAHRDIKSANVLLFERKKLKITDLGTSKRIGQASLIGGIKGTPYWMAPEVIKEEQTPEGWCKADVWSIGCTLYEMLTGVAPFRSRFQNPVAAMYHIVSGTTHPDFPADLSVEARDFLTRCFERDPSKRISASKLLRHPFINRKVDNQVKKLPLFKIIREDEELSKSARLPSIETRRRRERKISSAPAMRRKPTTDPLPML